MGRQELKEFMRKAAEVYREEDEIRKKVTIKSTPKPVIIDDLHKELRGEGVPTGLSQKMHEIVNKEPAIDSSSEPDLREEVGSAIKEAVEHKKNGKISEEGLTKIVQEAVSEHEKGFTKDDVRAIIQEVLKSELQKGAILSRYAPQVNATPVAIEVKDETQNLSMPLPSINDGGMIKRRHADASGFAGEDFTKVNITYPLVYREGKVHVYANIKYDQQERGLLYRIIEPQLSKEEQEKLDKIETTLIEELEVDFAALKMQTAEKYLKEKVDEVIIYYKMEISKRTRDLMDYFIHRDLIGLGKIEAMMQDANIEDISCDGVGIPIYVYHRDPRFGSIKTNISFNNADDLDSFVMKIAQRCNRSISVADPLLDGALPDGSRVQATFGTGISMKGSNFTIRKFTLDPLTCIDLLNYGTIGPEMLAYLWIAIENGKSVLIAGPTASGKTTMLNALSLFIRPELKIVSIEDTPELRLPHENWISQVARIGFGPETISGKKLGEISLFDLLKASLRQRPDTIIVGEVRGKEAYVLFQQIATGHPGISTIHAESMAAVVNRLRTPPINLPASLVQHLDILIVVTRQRLQGKYMRRTKEIVEVIGYDMEKDWPKVNTTYEWVPAKDKFNYTGKSLILKDVMETMGSDPAGIFSEVERRMKVLEWMQENGVRDYKNVGRVIHEYYQSPDTLMERIGED
ncbi:MAG: type II/IV secretion system ATPase subunit [archaeon]